MARILFILFVLNGSATSYKITDTIENGQVTKKLYLGRVKDVRKGDNHSLSIDNPSQILNTRKYIEYNISKHLDDAPPETEFTGNNPNKEIKSSFQPKRVNVVAQNGQLVIGAITGESFGTGSLTVNEANFNNTIPQGELHQTNTSDNEKVAYINNATKEPYPVNGHHGSNETMKDTSNPDIHIIQAQNGQITIGGITGGAFGSGSFTMNEPGRNKTNINQEKYFNSTYSGQSEDPTNNDLATQQDAASKPIISIATNDSTSIAIDNIEGGSYATNSFSIGHGEDRL